MIMVVRPSSSTRRTPNAVRAAGPRNCAGMHLGQLSLRCSPSSRIPRRSEGPVDVVSPGGIGAASTRICMHPANDSRLFARRLRNPVAVWHDAWQDEYTRKCHAFPKGEGLARPQAVAMASARCCVAARDHDYMHGTGTCSGGTDPARVQHLTSCTSGHGQQYYIPALHGTCHRKQCCTRQRHARSSRCTDTDCMTGWAVGHTLSLMIVDDHRTLMLHTDEAPPHQYASTLLEHRYQRPRACRPSPRLPSRGSFRVSLGRASCNRRCRCACRRVDALSRRRSRTDTRSQ